MSIPTLYDLPVPVIPNSSWESECEFRDWLLGLRAPIKTGTLVARIDANGVYYDLCANGQGFLWEKPVEPGDRIELERDALRKSRPIQNSFRTDGHIHWHRPLPLTLAGRHSFPKKEKLQSFDSRPAAGESTPNSSFLSYRVKTTRPDSRPVLLIPVSLLPYFSSFRRYLAAFAFNPLKASVKRDL